ncbi:capsule biosynthesis protein [Thiolinea disciformis]|uniref:capsule biosynthesis protein n=1 Tax=Thiolinea disciformis TaxID=125614 RepID=UPI000A06A16E|nr:capsular biosynthesis protein [Thiolinea disciformis]
MSSRRFLFLQGPATPFFNKLAQAIRELGHETLSINFCGGDQLFSPPRASINFKQPPSNWLNWLEKLHQQHRFTDLVLFGDTRPLHQEAIQFFKQNAVQIHVYEEGYLRPDWITLELDGVNGNSTLLKKPIDFWLAYKDIVTPESYSIGKSFLVRAWHDIKYRLANLTAKPVYPHYKTHRPYNASLEYLGWLLRLPNNKLWREYKDTWTIKNLIKSKRPFYVIPLQLNADSQIKVHSPFENVQQFIDQVLNSFSKNAPTDSKIVFKNHPLDTGLSRYNRYVKQGAKKLGIENRVIFLETGHLPTLLKNTKGTVVVNSTTATSALQHGSPTIALGTALFDLPSLCFQEGLDRFWLEGQAANQKAFKAFRNGLILLTQINGDFYTKRGIQLAVSGSLKKLHIYPVSAALTDELQTLPVNTPSYSYKSL